LPHSSTTLLLERLLLKSELPQVLLFHGPKDCEKLLFAKKLVNAQVNPTQDPVLESRIINEKHPDVQFFSLQAQDQFALHEIKSWIDEAHLSPFELKEKWIIIQDAEKLTTIHGNTLLKTLEEPLFSTHFILIAADLSKMLETVTSRAIKVPFFPLPSSSLNEILKTTLDANTYDTQLLSKVLSNSKENQTLLKLFLDKELDKLTKSAFDLAVSRQIFELPIVLDEMDKILGVEDFAKQNLEIFELFFAFICVFIQEVGLKKPRIFKNLIVLFELKESLLQSLKRHTKLKHVIERLLHELMSWA
jgi:hypothetical protein